MTNMPLILGQYRPLDSFIHRLDARAKIIAVLLLMILSLLTQSLLFYSINILMVILVLLKSGLEPKFIIKNMKPLGWFILITSVYHILFGARTGTILIEFWIVKITTGTLISALYYSLRLILFVLMAFIITLTTSPSELGEAVIKLLSPLKRLKVPVYDIGLIIFIALRFIPILYDEFLIIKQAQIVRGVSFDGPLRSRVVKLSSLIIPVISLAIKRADYLALAMEARGYRRENRRTFYSTANFGLAETVFVTTAVIMITGLFVWV